MRKIDYIIALCFISIFLYSCVHSNEYKYGCTFYGSHMFEYNTPGNNFFVSTESLKRFTQEIENKKTAKAIELGNKIFRINAKLPKEYKKLLSKYRKEKDTLYIFNAGSGYKLNLVISPLESIVRSFNIDVPFSGKEIKISAAYLSDEEAFQLLKNYFEFHEKKEAGSISCPEDKIRELKPIKDYVIMGMTCEKRIRVVELSTGGRKVEPMFIMDNLTGEILIKNILSCARASSWIYPEVTNVKQRNDAMALIISLNELSNPFFISKPSDIPGYEKSKLDSDIEKAIVPPFTIINKNGNDIIYGAYTYELLGGVVRRYKFCVKKGVISWAGCIELERDIGNAEYIE